MEICSESTKINILINNKYIIFSLNSPCIFIIPENDGSWRAETYVGFDYNKGLIAPF